MSSLKGTWKGSLCGQPYARPNEDLQNEVDMFPDLEELAVGNMRRNRQS